MPVSTEVLRSVPLFTGLTDAAVTAVAETAVEVEYDEGAVLVREGDTGDRFIVLAEGSAKIDKGGRQVAVLGSGDFVGEISLIDKGPRTATVTAAEHVHAYEISCSAVEALIDRSPAVRHGVLMALTRRVRELAALRDG